MNDWGLFSLGLFILMLGIIVCILVKFGVIKFREYRRHWIHYWLFSRTRPPCKMTIEESKIAWKLYYYWTGGVYMVVGVVLMISSL